MKLENETIESLLKIDFLSHSKNLNIDFELISNLNLASTSINGLKWENICLERIGDVTSYLSKNYRELYNKNWNNLAIEIRKNIVPTINEKLEFLIKEGQLLENMKDQILFDVMNIALFQSYSSMCKSEFYECLYKIYMSGYIPCGWNGKYPKGNIKVI
ncbi:hypothetical protein [Metabacillus fastidiosus]|uniref:Uncharacterized protein n=1 Tax=Metabacillus fastidiosus TaxID=1458 RepID=A0ABU6P135_9BACI|nr:hypothetical protein [Metabacillus fastidiosus]